MIQGVAAKWSFSSLSAINLENQGFTQNVHENVHETSEF